MIFSDDMTLEDPYGLDCLFDSLVNQSNDFAVASCRYRQNGILIEESLSRFIDEEECTPIMPLAGLVLRKSLNSTGGIDKRFIGVNYDLDLAMRLYAEGVPFFSVASMLMKNLNYAAQLDFRMKIKNTTENY